MNVEPPQMASSDFSKSAPSSAPRRMSLLPETFTPGDDDVICGRGKKCYTHTGNIRFRQRVSRMLPEYSQARSKVDKSQVLTKVVDQVRAASEGGFVKQDADTGRWYEVGDFLAREKTSQAFRDALHERYKSSTVAKKKRRQREQAKASEKMMKMPRSKFDFSTRIGKLSRKVKRTTSDERIQDILSASNMDMLERINRSSEMREDPVPLSIHSMDQGSRLSDRNSAASFHPGTSASMYGASLSPSSLPAARGRSNSYASYDDIHLGRPASVPPTLARSDSFDVMADMESMHHSLPEMGFKVEEEALFMEHDMHHSMPNLDYNHADEFEPIPLTNLSERSAKGPEDKKHAFLSKSDPRSGSASADSDDLLACLSKLMDTTIEDSGVNPYEPIPVQSSSDAAAAKATYKFRPIDDDNNVASMFDESERGKPHAS